MNPVYLFTGLTFITVIAAYFSFLRFFEFGFIEHKWYQISEKILWILSIVVWMADIVFLKGHFDSDLALGAQLVIQVVLNAVFFFWPIAILGLFARFRPEIQ